MSSIGGTTLSTTRAKFLDADAGRVEVRIFNLDATNAVYIAPGVDAVAEQGEIIRIQDFTILTGRYATMTLTAVASGGTPKISWVAI